MKKHTRFVLVVLGAALCGCSHRAPKTEAPTSARAPSSTSLRDWERAGPCAILGPNVHIFPVTRAQGMDVYGGLDPVTNAKYYTSTPEACEAQKYKAGKRIAGYVDDMSYANNCTTYGGPIVSEHEQKNLVPLYSIKNTVTKFKFQSLNQSGCKAQGFDVDPRPLGYVNP